MVYLQLGCHKDVKAGRRGPPENGSAHHTVIRGPRYTTHAVGTVGDLVNITTIHSSSLDSDRGSNKMEVFLSELARKRYSPRLNDCATRPISSEQWVPAYLETSQSRTQSITLSKTKPYGDETCLHT